MKKKLIDVKIDHALYQELVALRDKIGIPVAESLRRAIREYLAKQEKQTNGNPESL
jgi:metal-responsive CopG/Arc/MetJ family transcriptional regulator